MTAKTKKTTANKTYDSELADLLSGREHVLIGQRTCKADGRAHSANADGDFRWPMSGWAEAADWKPTKQCGNGLHFCAIGAIGGAVVRDSGSTIIAGELDLRWQIVIARTSECVCIDDEKHKAQRVFVVETDGTRGAMDAWLNARGIVGHHTTNTGGDGSTNTGGDGSTNTGGYRSTNTGGDGSTNTGGDGSTNTGGYGSTNTGGYRSTNTGGYRSTNSVKNNSLCKSGDNGVIVTIWFDQNDQQQVKAWTVGEGRDLKADTTYKIVDGVATEVIQ